MGVGLCWGECCGCVGGVMLVGGGSLKVSQEHTRNESLSQTTDTPQNMPPCVTLNICCVGLFVR